MPKDEGFVRDLTPQEIVELQEDAEESYQEIMQALKEAEAKETPASDAPTE